MRADGSGFFINRCTTGRRRDTNSGHVCVYCEDILGQFILDLSHSQVLRDSFRTIRNIVQTQGASSSTVCCVSVDVEKLGGLMF